MIYGADGKLTETKKGTNGFICVPTVMNLSDPDPMCMDAAVHQWMTDLMNKVLSQTANSLKITSVLHLLPTRKPQ